MLLALLGVCITTVGMAQTGNQPWDDPGGIEDAEIVIEKKREISLPPANRQFEKVPPLPTTGPLPTFDYSFPQFTYGLAPLAPRVRPLTLADEPLSKLYGNYVKAGFGNYFTPYLAAQLGNKRNPALAWNVGLEHLSSQSGVVDSLNSGSGRSAASVAVRSIGDKGTLRSAVNYERQRVHYYGYPTGLDVIPVRDSIRQIYHRVGVDLSVRPNGDNTNLDYTIDGRYHFQTDRYGAMEHVGGLKGDLHFGINDLFRGELLGGFWVNQRQDLTEQFRYFAQVQPVVVYTKDDLEVKGGINVLFDNDTLSNTNPAYLFPMIRAQYHVSDGLVPYLKIWGNVEMVTWHQLSVENPWIARETQLNNTVIPIEVVLGTQGAMGQFGFYELGASFGTVRNWYYYNLSPTDTGRFVAEYDTNIATRLNAFGELTATAGEGIFRGSLRADYFRYIRRDAANNPLPTVFAWHRPQVSLTALAQLNLANKFLLDVKAALLGGILVPDQAEALPPVYDLSVKAEYRITPRLGAFVDFNNVLNQSWTRYQNYPSRQLLFIGGVSYAF